MSSHGHWDHIGDNAEVQEHTGAQLAAHPLDRAWFVSPATLMAPFEIPPSVPAVDLAEGGEVRFGEIRLRVLHTPGHTKGSVCLHAEDAGLLLSGDTLFAGGWGRVDLPGGSADQMVESIDRLRSLDDGGAGATRPRLLDDDRPRARLDGPRREGSAPLRVAPARRPRSRATNGAPS